MWCYIYPGVHVQQGVEQLVCQSLRQWTQKWALWVIGMLIAFSCNVNNRKKITTHASQTRILQSCEKRGPYYYSSTFIPNKVQSASSASAANSALLGVMSCGRSTMIPQLLQLTNKTRDSHKNLFVCTAHAYINDIITILKITSVYTVHWALLVGQT